MSQNRIGSAFSTSGIEAVLDARYVKKTGDVMSGSLTITSNNPGGYNSSNVINSSGIAGSGVTSYYQVEPGAGDVFIGMSINGIQDWIIGVDNTDNDKFKITGNYAFGQSPSNDFLTVQNDGKIYFGASPTTGGAFLYNATVSNQFFGIYDSLNTLWYGISRGLPAPSGAVTLGGYYSGLGIGGNSTGGGNPIFGVLNRNQSSNGIGNVALTVYDSNEIDTFNYKIDDGNGNIIMKDGGNMQLGTTTGTKFGTVGGASGEKIGFFGHSPIVQPLLATGAGHSVDDIITTIQSLGLCRQS